MNKSQTILAKKLLKGFFLRRYISGSRRKDGYILFDEKINPIEFIAEKVKRGIDRYTGDKIWKKPRPGDLSLNLNVVRQLHGNCSLKKLYKKRSDIDASGSVNIQRKKQTKKIVKNEKANYLF